MKQIDHIFIDKIENKHCPLCDIWKPLIDFQKNITKWDGLQSLCKVCKGKINTTYKERNIDKVKAGDLRYRTENHEKVLESNRKYYRKYKDKIDARLRAYYRTPQGKINRVKCKIRRKMAEKNIEFTLTAREWEDILLKQNNLCAGCLCEFTETNKPTLDHIYPVKLGGGTTARNTQALCKSCNCSKADKVNWTYPFVREWT